MEHWLHLKLVWVYWYGETSFWESFDDQTVQEVFQIENLTKYVVVVEFLTGLVQRSL